MTPPRNIAAEDCLLGSMMLFENCIDEVELIISPGDFSTGYGPKLFRTIRDLRSGGTPVDLLTVHDATKADSDIDVDLILRLCESVPTGQHFSHWAKIVRKRSLERGLFYACHESLRSLAELDDSVESVASTLETEVHGILTGTVGTGSQHVADVLHSLAVDRERDVETAIPTGFSEVDALLNGGVRPSSLTILAARTSVGKTALAGCFALNVMKSGHHVLFITLEMTAAEIVARLLALLSNIPAAACERLDGLSTEERDRLADAENQLASMPLHVFDEPSSVTKIAALSRLHCRKNNTRLIVIDYLSLVETFDRRVPREQQVSQITRELKALAKTLEVPILLLAQLNRAVESRVSKRPRLSDLRESGAIEQDADSVLFIDRPAMRNPQDDPREAKLYIEKNRRGGRGEVALEFDGRTTSFKERKVY